MVRTDQPAQKTVNQLCLTIIPILTEIRKRYGTVFADPLSIYTIAALKRLKVLEIENDEGNLNVLKEQRALARQELAIREKEQNELCSRCEKDVEYALEQWRKESKGLSHTVSFLESRKALQLAELEGATQAVRDHFPLGGKSYFQGEQGYLEKAFSVVQMLEHRVHSVNVRLDEAQEELRRSTADFQGIHQSLQEWHGLQLDDAT